MLTDLRIAIRRLASSPGFSAAAVLTLALGIGANTTIFSLVDGILIKPLPYPESERLVGMWHSAPGLDMERFEQSDASHYNYAELTTSFENMGMHHIVTHNLSGDGDPARLVGARSTPSLFETLGVSPRLGRWFTEEEGQPGGEPVVILTEGLWQGRFGARADVLGETMRLDGVQHTVVGVMPAGFSYPREDVELYTSFVLDPADLNMGNFSYESVGRLADGVGLETATADMKEALYLLPERYPGDISRGMMESVGIAPFLVPLKEDVIGSVAPMLWMLLGTVGFVLLIACANVANLFLVRAEGRQREMALRSSLGASRGRLLRTYLAESLLLGGLGGALAIALTAAGHRLLLTQSGADLPRLSEVALDARVLAVAVGVSVCAGMFFGVLPMLRFSGAGVMGSLAEGGRRSTAGRGGQTVRNLLVAAQVALALVLLVSSGLMVRSFLHLREVPPGLNPENVLTLRVALPETEYTSVGAMSRFYRGLHEAVNELPGVESAAWINILPFSDGGNNNGTDIEDFPRSDDEVPFIHPTRVVTPGYFETMGIPLLAGRSLEWDDTREGRRSVIVSEAFAQQYWPDRDPIGKRLRSFTEDEWYSIVGVVGGVRGAGLAEDPLQVHYYPLVDREGLDFFMSSMTLTVHTAGPPLALVDPVRAKVRSLDPNLPIANVRTMEAYVARSIARTTFTMIMLIIAAGSALLLGAVGIYGVIAYVVSLRTQEIGIRMALGAQRRDVQRMVLRQGGVVVITGIAVGLLGAVALTRLMGALLFEISPLDATTFVATPLILGFVALVACLLPARRAASVSPSVALRSE